MNSSIYHFVFCDRNSSNNNITNSKTSDFEVSEKTTVSSKFPKPVRDHYPIITGQTVSLATRNFHVVRQGLLYSPHPVEHRWPTYERGQTVAYTVIGIEDCHLVHPSLLDGSCLDGSTKGDIEEAR